MQSSLCAGLVGCVLAMFGHVALVALALARLAARRVGPKVLPCGCVSTVILPL